MQSNEKDDANTDVLEEEGALVNEDECTVIDKKDLKRRDFYRRNCRRRTTFEYQT